MFQKKRRNQKGRKKIIELIKSEKILDLVCTLFDDELLLLDNCSLDKFEERRRFLIAVLDEK
jgi:hypothetical protein